VSELVENVKAEMTRYAEVAVIEFLKALDARPQEKQVLISRFAQYMGEMCATATFAILHVEVQTRALVDAKPPSGGLSH